MWSPVLPEKPTMLGPDGEPAMSGVATERARGTDWSVGSDDPSSPLPMANIKINISCQSRRVLAKLPHKSREARERQRRNTTILGSAGVLCSIVSCQRTAVRVAKQGDK